MKIQMHDREVDLLRTFLNRTSNYFEYGVGGSTCLAAGLVKGAISGIDSDPRWIDEVRKATSVSVANPIDLRHVDIGPTGGWGTPTSRQEEHKFPSYSLAIRDFSRTEFDFCLVDGRFRVACFLEALDCIAPDGVIAMHDYQSRPEYHLVEEFARPISSCQQLTFFVRRSGANSGDMKTARDAHRLNWA